MILYYKIAACYLGAKQPEQAVTYLNCILNESNQALREDILLYTRILGLMAHYDLENYSILEYLLNAAQRQVNNQEQASQLSIVTLSFFKNTLKTPVHGIFLFKNFETILLQLQNETQEGRAFVFLDMLKWVENKIDRE